MQYPNDDGVFTLETDASAQALGYILYQSSKTHGGRWHCCMWRQESSWCRIHYRVTELEMLSVVEALNKYSHFLIGRHFIFKSDHFSLRFISSLKDSSEGRLFRWSLQIQGFDFELVYLKGSLNHVADSLSRRDYPGCTDSTMDKLF